MSTNLADQIDRFSETEARIYEEIRDFKRPEEDLSERAVEEVEGRLEALAEQALCRNLRLARAHQEAGE